MDDTDQQRQAAIERLKNRRGFVPHLIAYLVVNTLIVVVWATTGGGFFWPIWIIGLWGVGLAMHAWSAFFQKPITEEDVRREIERGGTSVA